jgi:hypothetical protein
MPVQWHRLRTDHWRPFAIVSGIRSPTTSSALIETLTKAEIVDSVGPYFSTVDNLKSQQWTPSSQMRAITANLCTALNNTELVPDAGGISIEWERLDYMELIEDGMLWPGEVAHSKIDVSKRYESPIKSPVYKQT